MEKDENGFPIPRKKYSVLDDHGDTCTRIAVFSTAEVERAFPYVTKVEDLLALLSPWRQFARPIGYGRLVGRTVGSAPTITIGKYNVVVRQFLARDI